MQEDSSKVSAPAAAGGRKPVILAVDDEPQVLNAVALDLRRRFRARLPDPDRRIGGRGARRDPQAPAARRPGGAVPGRSAHARDDGRRVPERSPQGSPRGQEGVAHGVRRHRGRHRQHQPGGPGPLPDEALASARAEALPRDRGAARRLGARGARPLGRHPCRRHALVVGQPRGEGLPRAQPDPLPLARPRPRSGGARAVGERPRRRAQAAAAVLPRRRRAVGADAPGHRREGRPAHAGRREVLRPGRDRRRAGRAGGRGVRRLRGAQDRAHRARGDRRPGRHQLAHRKLPRLPERPHGRGSRRAGDGAGAPLRRRAARGAGGGHAARRAIRTAPSCWRRQRALLLRGGGRARRLGAQAGGPGRGAGHGRRPLLRRRAHRGGPLPRS